VSYTSEAIDLTEDCRELLQDAWHEVAKMKSALSNERMRAFRAERELRILKRKHELALGLLERARGEMRGK
jgi:hypothetical protein